MTDTTPPSAGATPESIARWMLSQSREVSDQAEMLNLQRGQLAEQEKTSAKQAEVLELQARELRKSLEEREREAQRRVREQAQLVFFTESRYKGRNGGPLDSSPPSITVTVVNTSSQPVYETRVYWKPGGENAAEVLGMILPGQSKAAACKLPAGTDPEGCRAEITFRDAHGIVLARDADGYLDDLLVAVRKGSLNAAYRKEGV